MAKWHYDLTGAEMIIRDVPMSDASLIDTGQFLMQSAATDRHQETISGVTGASTEMVAGVGIALEKIGTAGSQGGYPLQDPMDTQASINTPTATGQRWGKAIMNPLAVFLAEYSQATADAPAATTNASATTTPTITAIEQDIGGGWLYVCKGSSAANQGQLRYVKSTAANTPTLDSNINLTSAVDRLVKILPLNHEKTNLDSTGKMLKTTLAAGAGISMKIFQNYIQQNVGALEILRHKLHAGLNLPDVTLTHFFADVLILDHAYNKRV